MFNRSSTMKTFIVCLLFCLPALLLARPNQFDAKTAIANYARTHPNPDDAELECEVLGNSEEQEIGPLNAIVNRRLLWTRNTLYYSFGQRYTADQVRRVRAAVADLVRSTAINGRYCVNIQESNTAANRVVIRNCGGCSSYVGMIRGQQQMCLAPACISAHGTIIHEFLHAFGFHHEHMRSDRDNYVYVNFDNIQRGRESAFRKLVEGREVDLLNTRYDYTSVMHYGPYGFAIDRNVPTIVPLDSSARIGQRTRMSAMDIERVQILYGCKRAADSVYFKHLAHLY